MKIKPVYRVILIIALVLFAFWFLLTITGINARSVSSIIFMMLPNFIIWLVMAIISNHKQMWSIFALFFAVGTAIYFVSASGLVVRGSNSTINNIIYYIELAYMASNIIVCAVFWKRLLLLLSYKKSEEYKNAKQKSWDNEAAKFSGAKSEQHPIC